MNDRWDASQDDAQPVRRASWGELFPDSKQQQNEALWQWMAENGLTPVHFHVHFIDADGHAFRTFSYHPREEEVATLAFRMNAAAMYDNPALLPEGTEQVSLLRGDVVIETRYRNRDELRLAS